MQSIHHTFICGLVSAALSLPALAAGDHHQDHDHGGHQSHQETPSHQSAHGADDHHEHEANEAHLSAEAMRAAGVKTERAAQRPLQVRERLYGRIEPNAERTARVSATYPGTVLSVSVSVGDSVRQGEELARIRSRDSLQTYVVSAPLTGEVIERHINPGELAGNESLFLVQDLSSVWLTLTAYPDQRPSITVGQIVRLGDGSGAAPVEARLDYIAPRRDPHHQGTRLRATLDNANRQWAPGQRVVAELVTDTRAHSLAVRRTALQTFDGKTVVFVREGDTFRPQSIEVGARDGEFVEVLDGLTPGTEYVSENSYLIKADILKAGASHAH